MTEQVTPQPGFFKRNWKWLVPVGCLTPLLCCGGGGLIAVVSVFGVIKNSPVYTEAFAQASSNPEVTDALGAPIAAGWWVSGNFEESGGKGEANYAIPLNGTKTTGTLYVEAKKSAGTWNYQTLQVDVGGRRIDLLLDNGAEPEPDAEPDSVAEPREEDVSGE
jgi:hypothetical protein